MNQLTTFYEKAKNSKFNQWLFNRALWKMVPFNNPHKLKVIEFNDANLTIEAPYIKKNRNHIKGMHACLLATMCEYAVGLNLMLNIDPKAYRIILKKIEMTYHFQAKTAVTINWGIDKKEIDAIKKELEEHDAIFKDFTAEIYDKNRNHICTGIIQWQLKSWKKVKTKLTN